MGIIRKLLGSLILFGNWLFTPRGVKRPPQQQLEIDAQTARLALYQYAACPFCVKVRRAMKRQSLSITTRDPRESPQYREELTRGGGQLKVPCLRIEDENGDIRWMYESSTIITYLEGRFATA